MSDNKLLDLSFEFAVQIVELVDSITIPKSAYMTDQLGRAGTSISANIHEAQYAHGKKDFISKLEIALKETNETGFWLKLLARTGRIDQAQYQLLERERGTIQRLLIASCRTAKENQKGSS
ncbi:MAG: four helix bundle protein [Oscillospiraceae bacterium]|nr:four helix bundle protein [Oscillospiraceae bacterium]